MLAIVHSILKIPTQDLQHRFDVELPESVKQLLTYARNFLEFCSFQALHQVMKQPNYLSDQEFRQLMFDMMLAWETPSVTSENESKVRTNSILLIFSSSSLGIRDIWKDDALLYLIFQF